MSCIMSNGVTHPSSLILAHAPDQIPPAVFDLTITTGLCPPQADHQSLLEDGLSRHYLCHPCVGAWTPTPQRPFSAFARFFLKDNGLTLDVRGSAHQDIPIMQLQQGYCSRGCSHSFMFRLPRSLDPQVAPTAKAKFRAAGPFTPRIARLVACPGMWHHYVSDTSPPAAEYGWTFTSWIAALSAAPTSFSISVTQPSSNRDLCCPWIPKRGLRFVLTGFGYGVRSAFDP